jgi:hypothetical protein
LEVRHYMTFSVRTVIDRRLLLTVRMDRGVVQRLLPEGLRPRLVDGSAVGGICFLRLRDLHSAGLAVPGVITENVAHRFAITRDDAEGAESGVYVPRRDTSSRIAALLGGRLIEGELSRAKFEVHDTGSRVCINVVGRGGLEIQVTAHATVASTSSLFGTVEEESHFYQDACIAYSPNRRRGVIEAVELESERWTGTPMRVEHFCSSVFEDEETFPRGSWSLDSAMLVRNVRAEWSPATLVPPSLEGIGSPGRQS